MTPKDAAENPTIFKGKKVCAEIGYCLLSVVARIETIAIVVLLFIAKVFCLEESAKKLQKKTALSIINVRWITDNAMKFNLSSPQLFKNLPQYVRYFLLKHNVGDRVPLSQELSVLADQRAYNCVQNNDHFASLYIIYSNYELNKGLGLFYRLKNMELLNITNENEQEEANFLITQATDSLVSADHPFAPSLIPSVDIIEEKISTLLKDGDDDLREDFECSGDSMVYIIVKLLYGYSFLKECDEGFALFQQKTKEEVFHLIDNSTKHFEAIQANETWKAELDGILTAPIAEFTQKSEQSSPNVKDFAMKLLNCAYEELQGGLISSECFAHIRDQLESQTCEKSVHTA